MNKWFDDQYGLFRKEGNWVSKCKLRSGALKEVVLGKYPEMVRSEAYRRHKKLIQVLAVAKASQSESGSTPQE